MKIFEKYTKRQGLLLLINLLVIVDITAISIEIFFDLPGYILFNFQLFDYFVCAILLIQWGLAYRRAESKKSFLKSPHNIVDLIASIPFDIFLPVIIPQVNALRFLKILKLLRLVALFSRFAKSVQRFFKVSNLDKILGAVFLTIIFFTALYWVYGTSYDIFDDFYFVIVTLTTVGYGDITPHTFNERVITIALIFVGIIVFSTITAAISSYFTDRLLGANDVSFEEKLDEKEEKINIQFDELKSELAHTQKQLDAVSEELKKSNKRNDELKEELYNLIKNNQ